MENLRNSIWGYHKQDVRDLIFEKDIIIDSQRKDIEYMRAENARLSQQNTQKSANNANIIAKKHNNYKNLRAIELEQDHLNLQKELQ